MIRRAPIMPQWEIAPPNLSGISLSRLAPPKVWARIRSETLRRAGQRCERCMCREAERHRLHRKTWEESLDKTVGKYGLTFEASADGFLVTEVGAAYQVRMVDGRPSSCSCPAFQRSSTMCRHTRTVGLKVLLDPANEGLWGHASQGLHCHEVWDYDDGLQVATLVGLRALCASCHAVVHGNITDDIPLSLQEAWARAERYGQHKWTIHYGPFEAEPWARNLPRHVSRLCKGSESWDTRTAGS